MASISIPFGKGAQILEVADGRLRAVLMSRYTQSGTDNQNAVVQAALESPIASPRLYKLAKDKHKVLVITSDHTRPVPSRITLPCSSRSSD